MGLFRNVIVLSFSACLFAQEPAPEAPLPVTVDSRLELLAIVQHLSGYTSTLLNTDNNQYYREAAAWFAPYKDHPAVQSFALASRFGYAYDAPMFTMVCLSPPPALELQFPPEDCGAPRAGGADNLNYWLAQLRDFAVKSDFNNFFEARRPLYRQMEEQASARILGNYGRQLEDYFGVRQASFAIHFTPLLRGNYGVRIPQPDSSYAAFAVIGAASSSSGLPDIGSAEGLRGLLWHEFGHSFVNPVVDANLPLLDPSASLFPPVEAKMKAQAYTNWRTTVIESIVRAMVGRLYANHMGPSEGEVEVLRQRGQGFAYVPELYKRLQEYEAGRESWPRFSDFAPRLLSVLNELAARQLPPEFYAIPWGGTIGGVYADRSRLVIILPTAETDASVQSWIRSPGTGAMWLRDRLNPEAEVLDDTAALERDLSGKAIVTYGTMEGNLWLKRHRDSFPVQLRDGKAVAGSQEFSGEHLRLILSSPNPANPDLGVLIYTAPRASDIVGINAVVHGATGYVIADNTTILKAGDYTLSNGAWVLKPE